MERRAGGSASLRSAFIGLASSHVTRTLAGLLFWVLVARLAPAPSVGVAGAVIGTVTLLTQFTTVGLGSFLMAELPRLGPAPARQLFRLSGAVVLVVTAVVALLWSAGVLLFDAGNHSSLHASVDSLGIAALFLAITAMTAIGAVWDYGALGINHSPAQVVRNVIASLGRIPLILAWPWLVGPVDAAAILVAWAAPMALSLVAFAVQTRLSAGIGTPLEAGRDLLSRYWRRSMGHFLLDASLAAGPLVVPIVAAAVLVPGDNAYFTVAWMSASVVFVVPFTLAAALFASTAGEGGASFLRRSRRVLPTGLLLCAGGCLGTWLLGPWVLLPFGSDYVDESLPLMSVLVLAGFWMVVKDLLLDWYRLERLFTRAVTLALAASTLDVVGAVLGGLLIGGGRGVSIGWVAASGVQLLLATPLVVDFVHRIRRPEAGRTGTTRR